MYITRELVGMGFSPMVGVLLALSEVLELKEEELSARANGAGRGLELVAIEGLNGRAFLEIKQVHKNE